MIAVWRRLPTIVRAVVVGSLVVSFGTLPWAALVAANKRLWPAVPWSIPVMALYLRFYWRVLGGQGWPQSTAEWRRESLRARPLASTVWRAALLAGSLGLAGLVAVRIAFDELLALPRGPLPDASAIPAVMLAVHVLMTSVVAGVAEEAGFRGYMQAPIERRHGALVAILLVGIVFWLAHSMQYLGNARLLLLHAWFYLAASALLGILAHWTGSILSCIVLHTALDVLGFVLLAWLPSSAGGVDRPLLLGIACAAAAVLVTAAICSGRTLAHATRTRSGEQ